MTVVFGVLGLLVLVAIVLWLLGLPGDEDEEELAGLTTANWERIERRLEE